MTPWRVAGLLLALVGPVGAEEYATLPAKAIEHVGDRWYLLRYGAVTLDAGETEARSLSLAACPGGVDSPAELYVVAPGPFAWQKGWWHPVAYGPYEPDVQVILSNLSDAALTFRLKVSVRCRR